MKNPLLDLLLSDHRKIRTLLADLQREVSIPRANEERCLDLFRHFKATLVSHAKAEEFAFYANFETPRDSAQAKLQHFAFEGYEEHDLMDFLMKEMGMAEELSHQWRAQLTVLADMLERHLRTEEEVFFVQAEKFLDIEASEQLAKAYTQERDIIFEKKIGIRPLISMAPSLHH